MKDLKNELINLKVWTEDKEDYILNLAQLELNWIITKDHRLLHESDQDGIEDFEELEIIESFPIYNPALEQTTYFLRQCCNELHPEVDFDTEFETHQSGVFGRYQEKFGDDYSEYEHEQKFKILVSVLADMGYKLPFDN
jgi:hypothetical protein